MSSTTDLEDLLGITPLIKGKSKTIPASPELAMLGIILRAHTNWSKSYHPLAVKATTALQGRMADLVEKIVLSRE